MDYKNGMRSRTIENLDRSISEEIENDTEKAYKIGNRYVIIQEVNDGYEYTIADDLYREIDGGIYDNPYLSINEVAEDIANDLRMPHYNAKEGTYY